MTTRYLAAALQMNSTSDTTANEQMAVDLVRQAVSRGARFVSTPENTNYLGPHEEKVRLAEPLDGPTCRLFSGLAAELKIFLLLGSFNEKSTDPLCCHNSSVLFSPTGEIEAVYRKIHLFDVEVGDKVRFQESATILPGSEVVVADTDLGRFGLSICYDLRFPELYLELVRRGAEVLTIPSAFTLTTGKDHWHSLLRARAIESQCYVVAAAQYGSHDDRGLRESYGHAMIVDPWGQITAMAPDGPGLAIGEIDRDRVRKTREAMPVELHRRIGIDIQTERSGSMK